MVWGLQQGTQKGVPLEACTGVLVQQSADGCKGGSKGPPTVWVRWLSGHPRGHTLLMGLVP